MHREQRQRAQDYLKSRDIDCALFASSGTVTWLTGFAPPIQLGPHPFAGGPALVWYQDNHFTLIVLDAHATDAEPFDKQPGCTMLSYTGYAIEHPIAGTERLAAALRRVLPASGIHVGKVGVEERALPAFLLPVLQAILPDMSHQVAIDGWLEPLRILKSDEELRKLRDSFALTGIGQSTARATVRADLREIDVWTRIHSAIEQHAGQRIPLGNDCSVGHREFNIGAWPLDRRIRSGDSFITDLSARLDGYWSDSCGTYYAGAPSQEQEKLHRIVEDALELAISLIRPGAVAKEIDQSVRKFMEKTGYPVYPHHTGHGVGVTVHEAPRIVPYSYEVLQENMVIMLEPGIYLPGETAVRLEDAVLVTSDGAEVLTHHDKSLP